MPAKHSSKAGSKYGCLTVVRRYSKIGEKRILLVCQCDCGKEALARWDRLKTGRIVSCGCKRSKIGRTHGKCRGNGHKRRSYMTWGSMLSRCNNPNHKSYSNYGARGITVCERWMGKNGYPNFLLDMGEPPDGASLDRIENDKGYSPENCRWATAKEQQRNRRGNRLLSHDGRTQTLSAWAEEFKIEYMTLNGRLNRGWSMARALSVPAEKPRSGLKRKRD